MRRSTHKKNFKHHMAFWEGSWCEGRLTKKTLNTTWLSGKVLGAKVDSQKRSNLGRFLVQRSTRKKNLKRHMAFLEGSACEV